MRRLRPFLGSLLGFALLLPVSGCGSGTSSTSNSGSGGTGGGTVSSNGKIGTEGGTVTTSDAAVTIAVPVGALTKSVTITVAPAEAPADGALGPVYEIGPTGTQFATPVTLTLSYAGLDLGALDESSLRLATYGDAGWQILAGAAVDPDAKTVSGITSHLSPYGIVAAASGAVCGNVTRSASCGAAGPSGGSSGGRAPAPSDGSGAAAPAGGGSTDACPMPTCAESTDLCSAYPGSAVSGCTDDPSTGLSASCCFAPDAPICFEAGRNVGCGPSSGGGGGVSCALPTCADATDECAGYPGATFQDCAENANGYSGSCCFDRGTPVCISVTSGRACPADGPCPPPQRCAERDPCGDLPGATQTGCTDTDDGIEATCCFAVGTLPPSASSSAGAGSGSPTDPGGTAGGTSSGAGGAPSSSGGTGGAPGGTGGTPDSSGGAPAGTGGAPGGTGGMPGESGGTSGGMPPDAGMPMPGDPGCMMMDLPNGGDPSAPCGVIMNCPDGGYRVTCDPTLGTCRCMDAMGMMTTIDGSCDGFDDIAMLMACGFPTE